MSVYIEKSITNDSRHVNTVWEAIGGRFNLAMQNGPSGPIVSTKPNMGMIQFAGWVDLQAKIDGVPTQDQIDVKIDLSELETFEAFFAELAQKVINSENDLQGGELKQTPETEEV